MTDEFPEDKLVTGMTTEMTSMYNFDVYIEREATTLTPEQLKGTIPCRWVIVWKGNELRCRLVTKGFKQYIEDPSDTFASTPLLLSLKLLLLISIHRNYELIFGDVSTAFLHAPLPEGEEIFVWPPEEYYPGKDVVWQLKRPLYGLKTAPKHWQDYFASVLCDLGGIRLKSEANVFYYPKTENYVMIYVDDIIVCGKSPHELFQQIGEQVLLKETGRLREGETVKFLGRRLKRENGAIYLLPAENYIEEILEEHGLSKAKAATTPGSKDRKSSSLVSELDYDGAHNYRKATGKLMWLIPIRPDINYAVKELSRSLQAPTEEDYACLKHVLRYLKGTLHYSYELIPRLHPDADKQLELTMYVDSDWAGCKTTRKSTSGGVAVLLGCCIHHYSRTQSTIATSSGEAELYAIGTGTAEGLGILNFLTEACLVNKLTLTCLTDSTSAKAMATRYGMSKQTKHIQLRHLYVQDLVQGGLLKVKKVGTLENLADVLTKHVTRETTERHLSGIGIYYSEREQPVFEDYSAKPIYYIGAVFGAVYADDVYYIGDQDEIQLLWNSLYEVNAADHYTRGPTVTTAEESLELLTTAVLVRDQSLITTNTTFPAHYSNSSFVIPTMAKSNMTTTDVSKIYLWKQVRDSADHYARGCFDLGLWKPKDYMSTMRTSIHYATMRELFEELLEARDKPEMKKDHTILDLFGGLVEDVGTIRPIDETTYEEMRRGGSTTEHAAVRDSIAKTALLDLVFYYARGTLTTINDETPTCYSVMNYNTQKSALTQAWIEAIGTTDLGAAITTIPPTSALTTPYAFVDEDIVRDMHALRPIHQNESVLDQEITKSIAMREALSNASHSLSYTEYYDNKGALPTIKDGRGNLADYKDANNSLTGWLTTVATKLKDAEVESGDYSESQDNQLNYLARTIFGKIRGPPQEFGVRIVKTTGAGSEYYSDSSDMTLSNIKAIDWLTVVNDYSCSIEPRFTTQRMSILEKNYLFESIRCETMTPEYVVLCEPGKESTTGPGDVYYMIGTGDELWTLVSKTTLPTSRNNYNPLNCYFSLDSAVRNYCGLLRTKYEALHYEGVLESDTTPRVCAEERIYIAVFTMSCFNPGNVTKRNTCKTFNRLYSDYSAFSEPHRPYKFSSSEIQTMQVFSCPNYSFEKLNVLHGGSPSPHVQTLFDESGELTMQPLHYRLYTTTISLLSLPATVIGGLLNEHAPDYLIFCEDFLRFNLHTIFGPLEAHIYGSGLYDYFQRKARNQELPANSSEMKLLKLVDYWLEMKMTIYTTTSQWTEDRTKFVGDDQIMSAMTTANRWITHQVKLMKTTESTASVNRLDTITRHITAGFVTPTTWLDYRDRFAPLDANEKKHYYGRTQAYNADTTAKRSATTSAEDDPMDTQI